jgi:hypothetical protein
MRMIYANFRDFFFGLRWLLTAWISALVKRGIGGSSRYGVRKAFRMGSWAEKGVWGIRLEYGY